LSPATFAIDYFSCFPDTYYTQTNEIVNLPAKAEKYNLHNLHKRIDIQAASTFMIEAQNYRIDLSAKPDGLWGKASR